MVSECFYCDESIPDGSRFVFKDNVEYSCCDECLLSKTQWRKARDDDDNQDDSDAETSSAVTDENPVYNYISECCYCDEPLIASRFVYKHNKKYTCCEKCVPDKKNWHRDFNFYVPFRAYSKPPTHKCYHCKQNNSSSKHYVFKENEQHIVCPQCITHYELNDFNLVQTQYVQFHADKKDVKKQIANFNAIANRFCVHNVGCYRCNDDKIHGVRYEYKKNPEYNLCSDCYNNDDKGKYRAVLTPWKKPVPTGTYSTDNYTVSDGVRHLQFVLTRLGYMKLENTDELVGSYQHYTAMGVERFRTEHEIKGKDIRVYDKKTAKALQEVVLSL